jgi:hypothetical protein
VHARTAQDDRHVQVHPLDRQQSAIRLRRLRGPRSPLPSRLDFAPVVNPPQAAAAADRARLPRIDSADRDAAVSGRRRSSSEPQRPTFPVTGSTKPLPSLPELDHTLDVAAPDDPRRGGLHRLLGRRRQTVTGPPADADGPNNQDCYDSRIVDFLDVIGMSTLVPE